MDSTPPNLFHLTETPFFENLRQGCTENLELHLQDFIIEVYDVSSPNSAHRVYALDALILANIRLNSLKRSGLLESTNAAIASIVDTASDYLMHRISEASKNLPPFQPTPKAKSLREVQLRWSGNKTEFTELCYALHVGGFLGQDATVKEIVETLSEVFNADVTPEYAKSRFYTSKLRGNGYSPTAFIEKMLDKVQRFLKSEDERA